jgi:hypothetical protein
LAGFRGYVGSQSCVYDIVAVNNCNNIYSSSNSTTGSHKVTLQHACNNLNNFIIAGGSGGQGSTYYIRKIHSSGNYGIFFEGAFCNVYGIGSNAIIANCPYGVINYSASRLEIFNFTFANNTSADVASSSAFGAGPGHLRGHNLVLNSTTKVLTPLAPQVYEPHIVITKYNGVNGSTYMANYNQIATSTTAGTMRVFNTLTANWFILSSIPIGTVACVANRAVTVSITVTGMSGSPAVQLFVRPELAGIGTDDLAGTAIAVGASGTASVTFTPTESGMVTVRMRSWGGTNLTTTYADLSNLTIVGNATEAEARQMYGGTDGLLGATTHTENVCIV